MLGPKMTKVGIIGLRLSEIRGEDPLTTLRGIMPRTWALYDGLKRYGLETYIYVDPKASVDNVASYKTENFIRSPQRFIEMVENEFDYTVLAGTRIQTLLDQHPWLSQIKGGKLVGAFCYHNDPRPAPSAITSNLIGAAFTSPRYARQFNREYPGVYTRLLTTGQPRRTHSPRPPGGDVIFVGHIHNLSALSLFQKIARLIPDRRLHIITSRIRRPNSPAGEYIELSRLGDNAERADTVRRLFEDAAGEFPSNIQYHFLPHGEEYDIVETASVGLSICHSANWKLDNSKVVYYLSFGIPTISQLPSLSHRFCEQLEAGEAIRFGASAEEWTESIKRWTSWDLDRKVKLRRRAETMFDWENVAFEVYDMILEDMNPI